MKRIVSYLKDEQGIETLEWVAIGGLILGVAIATYPGALGTAITTVMTNISNALAGIAV
jgi:Flp pilus assembly pilin Flp